jgi:ketosteroid isomerase-like protein
MRGWVLLLLLSGTALSAQTSPQAIQWMAATERAFAAAAGEIGERNGFLTFFADDAIALRPGATGAGATVVLAKESLASQKMQTLPILDRLMWAPFTGQVSSDGSMGWLTGAYAVVNQLNLGAAVTGAYFSIWKHQPDGTWKVWFDEGISLPQMWRDATPFRAAPEPDAGPDGRVSETVLEAEQAVRSGGSMWRDRLSASVRLHRDGVMPLVDRDRALAWAAGAWKTVRYTVVKTDVAASDDLGVVLGGYDATTTTTGAPEHGTFVRVWKRGPAGWWRIVFETSAAAQ